MKLSTRLVLLILVCLLPILAAQVYSQVTLQAARRQQFSGLVLRQAETANADMVSIIDGVGRLATLVVQFPEVQAPGSHCDERLTTLQHDLPPYEFLALYASDGSTLCASASTPGAFEGGFQPWIGNPPSRVAVAGPLVVTPDATFLPVAIAVPGLGGSSQPRILIAALDPGWLAKHLDTATADHTPVMARATLIVTDRTGAVVGQIPSAPRSVGRKLPEWLRPPTSRNRLGVETVKDPAGHPFIAAYAPPRSTASGLGVIEAIALPDLTSDIDRATDRDLTVIVGAALMTLVLAWAASRRFIYKPTGALLLAARRWREGDLSARAVIKDTGSEFFALGQSFNAMAVGLQAREMERRLHSSVLEAQVAERTRELSESNNRLQVEIAGREKTEAALHQAQKLQAVGQLAGGIAHDFNNMLATVLGNLELMERRISQLGKGWAESDSERMMRLIGRATGAVQRGSQLTSRLLAFSRRQRLTVRSTDINALLGELITLATSTLGRRVQVVSELAEDLWPAMVDPSQVEAAILNLCLNARDAMPEGGRLTISTTNATLRSAAETECYDDDLAPGGYVRICISDTGTGMSPEVKVRAFDPFFTTKGPGGSGLGLSQVYGMARQTGGTVVIDSTLGKGTRVTLFLPLAARADYSETIPAEETSDHAASSNGLTDLVLVVDDDNAVRQVTVEMTRDLGCDVVQAAGGEQALALLETLESPPTLILLDYAMPGMNGLELARTLRERGMTAPIALVTGYAELSEDDVAVGRLAGLLRKPFTIRELRKLLVQLRAAASEQSKEPVAAVLMDS